MRLESPWALLLLLVIPALIWWRWKRSTVRGSIRFSSTQDAAKAGRSLRQTFAFLPAVVRIVALSLLVFAIARPQKGTEQIREVSEGIAIEMVVDRSSSMGAEMSYQNRRMNRLEVVKDVFEDFVLGDSRGLGGRENDLIGMISFARYPETICPLTLGHGALPKFLETVRLAQPRTEEDGTAIGDAIALAAARLETAEETLAKQAPDRADKYHIQSKVMIVLTDGRQTAGKRKPLEGAALAKEWGIKIYTIAVGGGKSNSGQGSFIDRFFGAGGGNDVDVVTLKAMADETGGRFYGAENAESLAAIYKEIDKLERTEIEAVRFTDYKELFLPFAMAALLLLAAEIILSNTLFRRIP